MTNERSDNQRSQEQIRHHYEVETRLAEKFIRSSKDERRTLYSAVYDELFRLVPDHPQLTRKVSLKQQRIYIRSQMRLLGRSLNSGTTFLEVGPGDCALAFEVAEHVSRVYAVDVSETITKSTHAPANFELIISDGCSIPVQNGSIDVVYSNHLMEHLHPDDAYDQLKNILNALRPGGQYICITPNRLNGPHDVSKHYDVVAKGFHLKEYTIGDLSRLFRQVGFAKVHVYLGARGTCVRLPTTLFSRFLETLLLVFPRKLSQRIARFMLIRLLIAPKLVAVKGHPIQS